jgi:hypothetical protein
LDYQAIVCNTYGCATSSVAHVTVGPPSPPAIQIQPTNTTVFSGDTATLTVGHTGTFPLAYQWLFNGSPLAGGTSHPLVIPNAQPSNAGIYQLIITNSLGSVTSSPAVLTISNSAPIITVQPVDVVAQDVDIVTLSVTATGSMPLSFQWYRTALDSSGLPVGGYVAVINGTSATLTLPVTAAGSETDREGQYQVIITNGFGSVSSSEPTVDISGYGFGN